MSSTERFRRQHDELLAIATSITRQLDPDRLRQDAGPVAAELALLMGKLKIHLAMEDDSLYPRMVASPDQRLANLAKTYQREMVEVSRAVTAFSDKWRMPRTIQQDPEAFCDQTRGLFRVLERRIDRENNELYPGADAA